MPSLEDLTTDCLASLRFAREALRRVELTADEDDIFGAATLKVHRHRVDLLAAQLDSYLSQVPRKASA